MAGRTWILKAKVGYWVPTKVAYLVSISAKNKSHGYGNVAGLASVSKETNTKTFRSSVMFDFLQTASR